MDQRTKLRLEILDKMGAPLVGAIAEMSGKEEQAKEGDQVREAELVAALLGRAVKTGLALSQSLKPVEKDGHADAVRLALAGLSSSLIAGYYRQTGRAPGDNDINRLVIAFEAVLTFSDNFTPSADNVLRLEAMDPAGFLVDENQIHIQYLNVFVPAVNAVAAYSFGRQEKKLAQEIAERLVSTASSLRTAIIDDADEKKARRLELQILQGLVRIYTDCHLAEMQRLISASEKERAEIAPADNAVSMEPVWQAFEKRVAMLEVLGHNLMPVETDTGPQPAAAETREAAAPVRPDPPPESAPPQPPPSEPPSPPATDIDSKEDAGYNPMAFFKPKQNDEETKG